MTTIRKKVDRKARHLRRMERKHEKKLRWAKRKVAEATPIVPDGPWGRIPERALKLVKLRTHYDSPYEKISSDSCVCSQPSSLAILGV